MLTSQLKGDTVTLMGCDKEPAPKGEQRLVISTTSKTSRRKVFTAIKLSKGKIRCSSHLTKLEKENKNYVYKIAS